MATIDILIKAKNEAGRVFKQVEREANAWAHNIKKNTEFLRGAFAAVGVAVLAVGTAIVAGAAKAIGAYMEDERAVAKLKEAHRAYGDEVEVNTAREAKFAEALMRKTNVSDESIKSSMAELRMLGMTTDQLEEGAKAVIALTHANVGEEGAVKLVALAYQGNFERLARFIPALKNANTETEKAAIVNAFLTRHFAAQQGEVRTLGGAWAAFKIEVGEAVEGVGAQLAEGGQIQGALEAVKTLVLQISEAFAGWAAGGGVNDAIYGAVQLMEDFRRRAYEVKALLGATTVLGGILGAQTGGDVVDEMERRKKFDEDMRKNRDRSNAGGKKAVSDFVGPMAPIDIAVADRSKDFEAEIKKLNEAAKLQDEMMKSKADRQEAINKGEEMVAEAKLEMQKKVKELSEEAAKKELDGKLTELDIARREISERAAAAREGLARDQEILDMGPREVRQAAKKKQKADIAAGEEQRKFDELAARKARPGTKLAPEDEAFMEAFKGRFWKKGIVDAEKQALADNEKKRMGLLEKNQRSLDDIRKELAKYNQAIVELNTQR